MEFIKNEKDPKELKDLILKKISKFLFESKCKQQEDWSKKINI